jgi:two-component system phosphate regulon response regulator OmpR
MSKQSSDSTTPAKRVLVVEDEPAVSNALKMVFVAIGYLVEVAEDAKAGLRAFEIGKHDLVVTDYALGAMTGLDLAHAIRSRLSSQPIILISAYAESLALRKERLANVNILLGKPFTLKEINARWQLYFPLPEIYERSGERAWLLRNAVEQWTCWLARSLPMPKLNVCF